MVSKNSYKQLLSSGSIGGMQIKNRICMAPMGTNLGELDGCVNKRVIDYYGARAKGGAGLIIVETTAIKHPIGVCTPRQLGISEDKHTVGLKKLVATIQSHEAKAAIQLQHAGKTATQDIAHGRAMWVPSKPLSAIGGMSDLTPEETGMMVGNLTSPKAKLHYHEMTKDDIGTLIADFSDAAMRAKKAGFDGVEIHGGHGYLISTFLSPAANRRTDEYGGVLENRARVMVEVISAVKEKVGKEFPVWVRLDAKEFKVENGITLDDACRASQLAEAAGADAIHVSAYANPALGHAFTDAPLVHKKCGFLEFAKAVKKQVSIPVIAVGRIEPEEGNRAIKDGIADFIAMGRKLIADPKLPNKLAKGEKKSVRPCICCYTCVEQIFINKSVCCAVNPSVGNEADFDIVPASKAKEILVIGGGPAGMEAARVAAFRGHKVTFCEKQQWLGGTTFLSALVNPENGKLSDYLVNQVNTLPITVQLGKEVTPDFVKKLNPDIIFMAHGAKREMPRIPGVDGENVFSGDDMRSLLSKGDKGPLKKLSVLKRAIVSGGSLLGANKDPDTVRKLSKIWMPFGKRVVIIGGTLVGIELAEFLIDRGRSVTVIDESRCLAIHMAIPRRWRVLHELRERGVTFLKKVKIEAIEKTQVVYVDKDESRKTVKYDSAIIAMGAVPDRDLYESLSGMGFDVQLLGDCREVNHIRGAIADGARMGRDV
jgi:2,4-dienoyl-CoA reductase-like NADH-dependent reductase (Old Yellow Enzyme family)